MNIFDKAVSQNKVSSEADLKKLFRLLVKRVHPDYSGNSRDFIELKKDYDISLLQLRDKVLRNKTVSNKLYTIKECTDIFIDLLASSFPIEEKARNSNTLYIKRVNTLNTALTAINKIHYNLIFSVEKEMLELKHNTGMVEQDYKKVLIFLYGYFDCLFSKGINNKAYIKKEYGNILKILEGRNMVQTIVLFDLLIDINFKSEGEIKQ